MQRALLALFALASIVGASTFGASIEHGLDEPAPERPRTERPSPGPVDDETLDPPSPYPRTVVAHSLERGLEWLAAAETRLADGSWPVPTGTGALGAPVAVSSLATLALMAGGNLPGRGEHAERVTRGLDYLLSRAVRDTADPRHGFIGGDGLSRMHGHGFATMTLAQGFAISPSGDLGARLRDALHGAVNLIERTQGAEGGWMYEPRLEPEHEGSVTICLVSALRAARDAGLLVQSDVIGRAEDYVRASQAESGLFRYTLGSDKTTLALTAAAVATLEATGSYDDPALIRGVDAITRALASGAWPGQDEFPHYERFYLALALWGLREREPFERWFTDELQLLVSTQNEDGSWSGSRYGSAYATAINCLVLALPDGTLPIFQR